MSRTRTIKSTTTRSSSSATRSQDRKEFKLFFLRTKRPSGKTIASTGLRRTRRRYAIFLLSPFVLTHGHIIGFYGRSPSCSWSSFGRVSLGARFYNTSVYRYNSTQPNTPRLFVVSYSSSYASCCAG